MWSANVETVVSTEDVVQASVDLARENGYLKEDND